MLNQILRSTAEALSRSSSVAEKQKNALKREMTYFGGVSTIDLSCVQWNRLQIHRNNRSYVMLMNICQMAWNSLLPSTVSGNIHFSLFDEENMPRLYEKFILEYYRCHYPALHARDSMIRWDLAEETNPAMIQLLPGMHSDITLRHGGKTLIIDAKFYRHALATNMGRQILHNANLYQIYTYVKNEDRARTGGVSGMLLYARTTEEIPPILDAVIGGNRIRVATLDLNGSFREISCTLDRIAEEYYPGICRQAGA